MNESYEIRYDMILGTYILTSLWLNLSISKNIIKEGDGPSERCKPPMENLGMYEYKNLNANKITSEQYFTDA